ncbi:hypothetical protein JNW88_00190 [Micromonospora sp. ATA32]|nr:hypothetical protein [Micromonospora sp. ATA32]
MTATTEVPAPPQAASTQRSCLVCGLPSDATECISCVIAADVAFERAADR